MNNNKKIDLEILKFSKEFIGYGNLSSQLWFVGMEEGGGNSKEEIIERLDAWKHSDYPAVADIVDFHNKIGITQHFDGEVKIQKTWSKLIKFQLCLLNQPSDREAIRDFQKNYFGRTKSKNAILELMPLPSPGISNWNYNRYSNLSFLKDRKSYFNELVDYRINLLRETILRYRPALILFYGLGYLNHWEKIVGHKFFFNPEHDFYFYTEDQTNFILLKHPVSHIKTKYYENIAKLCSIQLNLK